MWWIILGLVIGIPLIALVWILADPLGRQVVHGPHPQGQHCGPGCMTKRQYRFLQKMNKR